MNILIVKAGNFNVTVFRSLDFSFLSIAMHITNCNPKEKELMRNEVERFVVVCKIKCIDEALDACVVICGHIEETFAIPSQNFV